MIVTVDSNVLIADNAANGVCRKLMIQLLTTTTTVVASEFIFGETAEKLRLKIKLTPERVVRVMMDYRNSGAVQLVEPAAMPADVCAEAKDLPVLGTAVAAQADFLITGDTSMLELKEYGKCRIVTPRQLLDMLHAARHRNLDA